MIVNTPLPNTRLTDLLYGKASLQKIPLGGTFELSPVCNFQCRMCYVRKTTKEVEESLRPIMTLEDWRRIAAQAREAGMLYLLLTGGEPLLWPDFWTLYEELISMGFVISINTNGSMIDDEAIERFRKLPPRMIHITLYGAGDETYERLCGAKHVFDRVIHAVDGLQKAGVPVGLNCSLTPYNVKDLPAIQAFAEERNLVLNATSYMFPPIRRDETRTGENEARFTPEEAAFYRLKVYELQNSRQDYEKLLQNILKGSIDPPGLDAGCTDPVDGKIRCRAGTASFWITWDGWLTPCGLMTEPRVDLKQKEFPAAWKELTELTEKVRLSGTCDKCPNLNICHPCAAMALAETGSFSGIPVYLCRMVLHMRKIAEETLQTNGHETEEV